MQLGHSSQLDLAGSSQTAQRTASFAASRTSLGSSSAASLACSPASRLQQCMHQIVPYQGETTYRGASSDRFYICQAACASYC